MSIEDNKKTVRRFYEALVRGNYDDVAGLCHEDFVFYSQIDTPRRGVEGFVSAEKKHVDTAKEFRMTVETMVAEGDQVAAYVVVEGIPATAFYGTPPRGERFRFSMLNLFTFADGKVIEKRAHYDRMDVITQWGGGSA